MGFLESISAMMPTLRSVEERSEIELHADAGPAQAKETAGRSDRLSRTL
jgi:hypothetical protein